MRERWSSVIKKEYCEIEFEIVNLTLKDVLSASKPEGGMGDAWGDGDDWFEDTESPTEDPVTGGGSDFGGDSDDDFGDLGL